MIRVAILCWLMISASVSLAAIPVGFNSQPVYGLVGWWPMNEASGTTINDKSGFAAALAVTNSSGWGNGVALSGWTITASNAIAEATDNDLHDIGTGSFTVGVWFNCGPQTSAGTAVISKTPFAFMLGRWYLDLGLSVGNRIAFSVQTNTGSGVVVITNTANLSGFTNNLWHSVFGMVDRQAGVIAIYTDGVLDNSRPVSWSTIDLSNTSRFRIGAFGSADGTQPAYCLQGSFDDARIYNRSLSAEEIKLLHNSGSASQR